MTTKITSNVSREVRSTVMDKGMRDLIVTMTPEYLEIRCKGLGDSAVWSYAQLYNRAFTEGRIRRKGRKK
jgi:hypothetical protein